jgi:hypothetical protein
MYEQTPFLILQAVKFCQTELTNLSNSGFCRNNLVDASNFGSFAVRLVDVPTKRHTSQLPERLYAEQKVADFWPVRNHHRSRNGIIHLQLSSHNPNDK